jgi:hypothetical protein
VGARVHHCNARTEGDDHLVPANSVLVQVGDQYASHKVEDQ